jgi:hypothetical protein
MMTNPTLAVAPSRPLFHRFFMVLALLQLPLALYLYSQWQNTQQHNQQLARQLEQQQRSQQLQLKRIGQRLGQLQAELGQLTAVGQRLVNDYDLGDEISLQRPDPNLLKRPFSGFADLHQGLARLSAQSREQGMTLAALESLLLNLHINEITRIQGHPVPDGTVFVSVPVSASGGIPSPAAPAGTRAWIFQVNWGSRSPPPPPAWSARSSITPPSAAWSKSTMARAGSPVMPMWIPSWSRWVTLRGSGSAYCLDGTHRSGDRGPFALRSTERVKSAGPGALSQPN